MNPRRPCASILPSLLCSAKPLLRTTCDVGVQRTKFVENRIAIHDRKKKIEDDQTDLLADLLVDPQRFETIVRDDDLDSLHRSASLRPSSAISTSSSTNRISSRLALLIEHFDVGRNRARRRSHAFLGRADDGEPASFALALDRLGIVSEGGGTTVNSGGREEAAISFAFCGFLPKFLK